MQLELAKAPAFLLITKADEQRMAQAHEAYRSGQSMEEIAQSLGFAPNELEALTRTQPWLEIQKERANFRAGKLVDQIHDVAEHSLGNMRQLNQRISEVLQPAHDPEGKLIPMAPADLKDVADAMKSGAATARLFSEAVTGGDEVVEQTNNFVNYLQVLNNPK